VDDDADMLGYGATQQSPFVGGAAPANDMSQPSPGCVRQALVAARTAECCV